MNNYCGNREIVQMAKKYFHVVERNRMDTSAQGKSNHYLDHQRLINLEILEEKIPQNRKIQRVGTYSL